VAASNGKGGGASSAATVTISHSSRENLIRQPPFRNSHSLNQSGLFSENADGRMESSGMSGQNSGDNRTHPLIQQRLQSLKQSQAYVEHLSTCHKHLTLLVSKIKQFIIEFQEKGQLERESVMREIFLEICGKGGNGVSYCEACFRDFVRGGRMNEIVASSEDQNGNFSNITVGQHHNSGGIPSGNGTTSQRGHHPSADDQHGPLATLSHQCTKCHLTSFCHHSECNEKLTYHHPHKICEIMQEVKNMDLVEWSQQERYGGEGEDDLQAAINRPTNSDTIDPMNGGGGEPIPITNSQSNNEMASQPQQLHSQTSETLAQVHAHREYVDNIILKRHEQTVHSRETTKLMNELREWSDKTRTELSTFLLTEKERQDKEGLNQYILDDDLRRINSFLTASLYQREHFLSETEDKSMKSVLNNPLQDFYSTNFKESNPDFILQFRLIQMVLQLREKLAANDKHTQALKQKVSGLEKKLESEKKAFQRQIADRDFSIDELSSKNRALQMNYENIQEKFHQALVFSKKRSKKLAPTLSVSTQTDVGQTYSLLTNASRQIQTLKVQLQSLRDHQLRQDDKYVNYMDSLEEEIQKKTSEVDLRMARTNMALQQARAKLRGSKINESAPSVEIQTDPITDLKSISVEHQGIQVPELRLPLLKVRTRSQSVAAFHAGATSPGTVPDSDTTPTPGTPSGSDSSLNTAVAQEIFDMQNKMKSLEEKKATRKRSGSQAAIDINASHNRLPSSRSTSSESKALLNLKYSRYLTYATRDHHILVQRMAQDNWCLFAKLSKLQLIANQLTLDSDFINYDVDLRAKLMLRLYDRARTYLQCWRIRHNLYVRLRLRLEKAFKTYMIKTTTEFQNQTDPEKVAGKVKSSSSKKSSYEDIVSNLSLFLPDSYERQWYSLTTGYKKNVHALVSRESSKLELLSKHERLRIDALAPLWKYNFQELSLDTRKTVLAEFCEYVKMGEKETDEEKKHLLSRIALHIENNDRFGDIVDSVADGDTTTIATAVQSAEKPNALQLKRSATIMPRVSNRDKISSADARTFVQKSMSHNASHSFTLADVPRDGIDPELLLKKKKLEFQFENDFKEMLGKNDSARDSARGNKNMPTLDLNDNNEDNSGEGGDSSPRLTFSKMKTERRESIPLIEEEKASLTPTSMRTNIVAKDPVRG